MPPRPVEIADSVLIYDPSADKWYSGWWNIVTQKASNLYKAINISSSGTSTIITGVSGKRIVVSSIFFTVGGEVNVTLYSSGTAISGPMDFGGTSEPRGMVSNFGMNGLELGDGSSFQINLSAAVQVSGMVVYQLR